MSDKVEIDEVTLDDDTIVGDNGHAKEQPKAGYRPQEFPVEKIQQEQGKIKIADKIIDAVGDKLKQLNILPPGLLMSMVALDMLDYLIEGDGTDIDQEHLVTELIKSLDMRMRAVRGGLMNKAVILTSDEQRHAPDNPFGDVSMRM